MLSSQRGKVKKLYYFSVRGFLQFDVNSETNTISPTLKTLLLNYDTNQSPVIKVLVHSINQSNHQ
jgi:hypothetical protein